MNLNDEGVIVTEEQAKAIDQQEGAAAEAEAVADEEARETEEIQGMVDLARSVESGEG